MFLLYRRICHFGNACWRARSATGIDLDEDALETAQENAHLNSVQVTFQHVNVFDHLRTMTSKGMQADVVILDPAKLAGCTEEIKRAHRTYGDINRLGMQAVRPGGILLTCSCSGLVSERDFLSILTRSAAEAGVVLQIFKITGASSDHPFSTVFPKADTSRQSLQGFSPYKKYIRRQITRLYENYFKG